MIIDIPSVSSLKGLIVLEGASSSRFPCLALRAACWLQGEVPRCKWEPDFSPFEASQGCRLLGWSALHILNHRTTLLANQTLFFKTRGESMERDATSRGKLFSGRTRLGWIWLAVGVTRRCVLLWKEASLSRPWDARKRLFS